MKRKSRARCEQCQGKIWVEGQRIGLRSRSISKGRQFEPNRSRSVLGDSADKENQPYRANRRSVSKQRRRSRNKGSRSRSRSNLGKRKANNRSKTRNKSRLNTRITPISKKGYKLLLRERNMKTLALSQFMDVHRTNLIGKLKQNLLFQPSIKNDQERREIGMDIKQIVFFRWKLIKSQKPIEPKQFEQELEQLKYEGKRILQGGKSPSPLTS